MSRIGKQPIIIPEGVKVTIDADNLVTVTGPLGTLSQQVSLRTEVKIEGNELLVINNHPSDKQARAFHGLYRQLLANMIEGVSKGFEKSLVIKGVGYRVNLVNEKQATLSVGLSHTVDVFAPEGITLEAERNTIKVKGFDKQLVGQVASNIRSVRPVEPYHGYGIAYSDEVVYRKDTKSGK